MCVVCMVVGGGTRISRDPRVEGVRRRKSAEGGLRGQATGMRWVEAHKKSRCRCLRCVLR